LILINHANIVLDVCC